MSQLSAPLDLFLALTGRCNLACKHCNASSSRNCRQELSLKSWLSIVDEAVALKIFNFTISGGEPFLRKGLFTLLDKIENTHIHFSINSNASLIDEQAAGKLKQYKKLRHVMVGLDGSSGKTHDLLRGKGAFARGLSGIKNLIASLGPGRVLVFCVVSKFNILDLENILQLAKELKLTSVQFEPLLWEGNARLHRRELELNHRQSQYVYQKIQQLRKKYGKMVGGNYFSMWQHFKDMGSADLREFEKSGISACLSACSAANKLVIRPDGWVTPCDRLWDYKIENIRNKSLKEIWLNAPKLREFRARFGRHIDEVAECRDCKYRFICKGGCPAAPYYETGSLIGRDVDSCYRIFKGEEIYAPA